MDVDIFGDGGADDDLGDEIARADTDEIVQRTRMLENEMKVLKNETMRLSHDISSNKERIKENNDKIKLNKQLPYLVANVIELLDMDAEDDVEEDGANVDLDAHRKGKCCVLKTSTRQTIFLPVPGLVDTEKLKPADLVGVNKDSYLILEALPDEYDSRVKAMEVDEKPTDEFNDVGGCDDQIQELVEAIVLPMTHKERFINIGIKPPKGCLMYGPPGTGKTLMARACAASTSACFLKLAGPQLVQMFIGDGAKLVRDAFKLAKEKQPAIIFIDILDPALLRSGRIDRKVEFKLPNEEACARIMQIHSRKMNCSPDVNYEELGRCCDDFNGAQLKAVCVEAGMLALRREGTEIGHEDFMEGITQVQAKKKASLAYYA